MKMSQKAVSSKTLNTTSSKTVPKAVPNSNRTSQTKSVKKPEEKVERKPNVMTNKSVKTTVKPVNSVNDKKKTNITTTETKKKSENISKSITNIKTNTVSKPLSKNLNSKTQSQSNVKTNSKLIESNHKSNVTKTNGIIRKEGSIPLKKNVTQTKDNKQITAKKIDQVPKKLDVPVQIKQKIETDFETNVENNGKEKQMESEDQFNKESSDEQYVSLATLESYSYKKTQKSSESVLAEPPSICDTDIDEMINNITDNQTNDDFPSDYCDDFEDYESDFEDDEEEEEEEPEEPEEQHLSDDNRSNEQNVRQEFTERQKDLFERKKSINKYDDQINDKILMQKTVSNEERNDSSDVSHIYTSNTNTNTKPKEFSNSLLTQSVKSAKIRSEIEIQRNKTLKRSKELLEIIKLDEISFTNFDLPQINYDLFIKTFGRKDTKQVSCQTCEREDNETQTDFLQMSQKWTQNPSFTPLVSGDENQMNESNHSIDSQPKVKPFDLIQFLTKAETLMSAIIDSECDDKHSLNQRSLPKGADKFSTNVSVIKCLSLAKKCPISYTFTNSLYLFCVQNVSKISGSAEKSMISVWSLMSDRTEPIRVLICRSHIVRAFSEQNLVVSAMIDGSVALWDITQFSVCDKELSVESNKFTLRTPSYNCALTSKGHDFPIVDIKRLFDSETSDRPLIHFATIDENGVIIVWAITEGQEETNDSLLSQTTEHKITRISATNYLDKFDFESNLIRITSFECQPNDWTNFYCGTDNGLVIRCSSIEETVNNLPKIYQKSYLNSIWTKVSVISFNKSEVSKFLVSFSDGLLSYYSITNENPLIVLNSNEMPIIDFKWISNNSQMSFIALNNSNQILIWDLNESNEQNFKPIIKYRHSNDRILSITLWKGFKTFLIFGCDSGQTLVFDFCIH